MIWEMGFTASDMGFKYDNSKKTTTVFIVNYR